MKINKAYAIFMIVISVLFFIEGEIVLNLAFYCGILSLFISLVSLIVLYFGINMEVEFNQDRYNTADKYEFNLKLINKLYFFVPFVGIKYISGDKAVNKMLHMNIRDTKRIKSEIVFKYRGNYEFNDFKLEIKDIMFIFTKYKCLKNKPKILVCPKVWNMREDGIAQLNYVLKKYINNNLIENDYLNVNDIRKYNYNDSYKKIHWKVTSKTGQLYVKKYDNFDNDNIKVFIDMNEHIMDHGKNVEEKYIEYTASILNYIMDKHSKFEIYFNNYNENIIFSKGNTAFGKVLEYLASNKCGGKKNLFDNISGYVNKLSKKDFICIILFKIDKDVSAKLINLEKNGVKCIVFYFESEDLTESRIQCFSMLKLIRNG